MNFGFLFRSVDPFLYSTKPEQFLVCTGGKECEQVISFVLDDLPGIKDEGRKKEIDNTVARRRKCEIEFGWEKVAGYRKSLLRPATVSLFPTPDIPDASVLVFPLYASSYLCSLE